MRCLSCRLLQEGLLPPCLLLLASPLLSLPLHDAAVLLHRLAPMLQLLLELPHPLLLLLLLFFQTLFFLQLQPLIPAIFLRIHLALRAGKLFTSLGLPLLSQLIGCSLRLLPLAGDKVQGNVALAVFSKMRGQLRVLHNFLDFLQRTDRRWLLVDVMKIMKAGWTLPNPQSKVGFGFGHNRRSAEPLRGSAALGGADPGDQRAEAL
mmetsp:Transcript_44533/g.73202  ORF Transcript_44533/g.73202 Transcript_44533/m.73202 type:complete len:206 (+) Transcript_44533:362-979(+)